MVPRGNLFSDISASWLGLAERLSLRLNTPDERKRERRQARRIGSHVKYLPTSWHRRSLCLVSSRRRSKRSGAFASRTVSRGRNLVRRSRQLDHHRSQAGHPIRARRKQKKGEKTYRSVRSSLHPVPSEERVRPVNLHNRAITINPSLISFHLDEVVRDLRYNLAVAFCNWSECVSWPKKSWTGEQRGAGSRRISASVKRATMILRMAGRFVCDRPCPSSCFSRTQRLALQGSHWRLFSCNHDWSERGSRQVVPSSFSVFYLWGNRSQLRFNTPLVLLKIIRVSSNNFVKDAAETKRTRGRDEADKKLKVRGGITISEFNGEFTWTWRLKPAGIVNSSEESFAGSQRRCRLRLSPDAIQGKSHARKSTR